MVIRSHQKGNALVEILSICIVTILIYIFLISPYQAIDDKKNSELQTMMMSIKGSKLEPIFNAQTQDFMSDGKLSNKEFNELEVMFNAYQTSTITSSQEQFFESTSAKFEAENQSDENKHALAIFFMISFMLVVTSIGFFKVVSK